MKIKSFLLLLFAASFLSAKADYFEGYIITLKGDTTKGEVDVTLDKKGLDPKEYGGIRFQYLEDLVKFKEGDSKKKYDCNDILGFGFLYNGKWYHFISLNPKKNKIDMGGSNTNG